MQNIDEAWEEYENECVEPHISNYERAVIHAAFLAGCISQQCRRSELDLEFLAEQPEPMKKLERLQAMLDENAKAIKKVVKEIEFLHGFQDPRGM